MKKETKKVAKHKRPSWDQYFLDLTEIIGERGTCDMGAGDYRGKGKNKCSRY